MPALFATALAAALALPLTGPAAPAQAAPPGEKDVTAVLFEWRFDSVARACTDRLGPDGYGAVQVSPPQEHIPGPQWWTSYQPVSYKIAGRLGDRTAFKNMIETCHAAGVKVIADSVINHMSAGSGVGTGGSPYTKYDYPGLYSGADMDDCRTAIADYRNRADVQNCELVQLADLDTAEPYVRDRIAGYLNDLLSLGVDGFRIDAAKHMPAADLAAIKSRLTRPDVYWKQEAIFGAGEAVDPAEYRGTGDVQEFRFGRDLKRVFQNEKLAYLKNFGEAWGYLPSAGASVFVDNHDTERGGDTLNAKDGRTYTLAQVFTLAWPYGAPDVHSGYAWTDKDAGPPNGGAVTACGSDGWTCQHARPEIASMVGFRNATRGRAVTDWWDDGDDRIAFGRGSAGFVAVNHTGTALTRTYSTSLAPGAYCDVQTGGQVTVAAGGALTATIAPESALAVHVGARTCGTPGSGRSAAAFGVKAETTWGENLYVVGDLPALGAWNPNAALALDPAAYPTWTRTVPLPPGTTFAYKYVRKTPTGTITWESGPNRTATTPTIDAPLNLTDTWRP
ncbi:carbohydrate-binding module family 20 domain-containing protein [Streptomyces sp. BI20]|uniref:carbohydrate-binding module family 20 domain-containing protein n=1 Tax=Streptomyces sp. BI20 TaxID=3403460 RepID=UPI003C716300